MNESALWLNEVSNNALKILITTLYNLDIMWDNGIQRHTEDRGLMMKENVFWQLDYIVMNIKRYAQKLMWTHCACIKRGQRRSQGRLHSSKTGANPWIESFSTDKGWRKSKWKSW